MKGKNYVIDYISDYFGCCWGGSLADKQLHPDAVYHKENPECGSYSCSNSLAIKLLRNHR